MNEPETPAVVNNEGEAPPSVPDEKKGADVTPINTDDKEEAEIAVPGDEAAADVSMDDDGEDDDEADDEADDEDDDEADDEDEDDDEHGLNRSADSPDDSSFASDIPPPPAEGVEVDTDAEEEVPTDEEHEEPKTPKTNITVITSSAVASSPPSKEEIAKHTTKIAARLEKAVEDSVGHQLRSPDLVPLTTNYQTMRKRLRSMVQSAKSYQKATQKLEQARSNVSKMKCEACVEPNYRKRPIHIQYGMTYVTLSLFLVVPRICRSCQRHSPP
jgi:hypothetical protein